MNEEIIQVPSGYSCSTSRTGSTKPEPSCNEDVSDDIPRDEDELLSVVLEEDVIADDEISITVDKFFDSHNDCPQKCCSIFSKAEVTNLLLGSRALDYYSDGYNRLNLVILAQLRVLLRKKFSESRTRNGKGRKIREKTRCKFMIEGENVCKKFFLFVHDVGEKRWRNLLQIYAKDGLVEKRHGLCSKKPANTTTFECTQYIVEFIKNYAEEHALFVPGKPMNQRILPSSESKKSIYDKYCSACHSNVDSNVNHKPVSLSVFKRVWNSCCPHIILQRPRTDSHISNQENCTSHNELYLPNHEKKNYFK